MTKDQVELWMDRVAAWPEAAQVEAMQSLLAIEQRLGEPYRLSEDERAAVRKSLDEMRRGVFASEEAVEAVFARYRR
jgi:hypothetical protein